MKGIEVQKCILHESSLDSDVVWRVDIGISLSIYFVNAVGFDAETPKVP